MNAQREALAVFLAVVMGVSLIGFVAGTSEEAPQPAPSGAQRKTPKVPPAKSYAEQRNHTSAAMQWPSGQEAKAKPRAASVAHRASRRAYDGAPPTIPHPVAQGGAPECLACHEKGMRIGELVASPMSHRRYESCTQCHVVSEAVIGGGLTDGLRNGFVGTYSAGRGGRWGAGAPPVMPHAEFMRENCTSCHGRLGQHPLRSSHPERRSCMQCHAPAAHLEQR